MFIDLILERRKKELLNFVNLTKGSFMQARLVFMLLGIVATLIVCYLFFGFENKVVVITIVGTGAAIGYKFPYFTLLLQKKEVEERIANIFPDFAQAFSIIMPTRNNILTAMKEAVEFTAEPLQTKLIDVIKKIDAEGDKREFYLELADYVGTADAYTIMDQLYKFSVQGYDEETLRKQQDMIKKMQEDKMDFISDKKTNSMDNIGILPLLSASVFIACFVGVILIRKFNEAMSIL